MPQKKNPDVPELVRGKSARVVGHLTSLLVLMKAQPLAYNKDNQEDKEPLFDTVDTLADCLAIMTELIGTGLTPNVERMREAASEGYATATDLADYLVRRGMPFRQAHHAVGAAVALAEKKKRPLNELSLEELKSIDATFAQDALETFSLPKAMERRNVTGAPGTREVKKQLERWKKQLADS